MKLSESFWKTNEILLKAHFCENQTEHNWTKGLKIFRKIFSEFFVRYLQITLNLTRQFSPHTSSKFIFQNTLRFDAY